MTHITLTLSNYLQIPIEGILDFFRAIYKAIEKSQMTRAIVITREHMMKHRVYRETYRELSKLSDRELKDIGISRGEIHWIAMNSFQENQD